MANILWNCKACKVTVRTVFPAPREFSKNCPACRNRMRGEPVVGEVSGVKCDIRCTSAKRHLCNCSCGGKNHGADWSQVGRPINELLVAA